MSFCEGTYHDLIQETLLKCLISSIFLAEHTLLRVYPKFPQIVYRGLIYVSAIIMTSVRSVTIFQNRENKYQRL